MSPGPSDDPLDEDGPAAGLRRRLPARRGVTRPLPRRSAHRDGRLGALGRMKGHDVADGRLNAGFDSDPAADRQRRQHRAGRHPVIADVSVEQEQAHAQDEPRDERGG